MEDMKKTIEALIIKMESIGYKEVGFEVLDKEDNSIYFNVINLDGEEASVRVDIDCDYQVLYEDWIIYECTEENTDWIIIERM